MERVVPHDLLRRIHARHLRVAERISNFIRRNADVGHVDRRVVIEQTVEHARLESLELAVVLCLENVVDSHRIACRKRFFRARRRRAHHQRKQQSKRGRFFPNTLRTKMVFQSIFLSARDRFSQKRILSVPRDVIFILRYDRAVDNNNRRIS